MDLQITQFLDDLAAKSGKKQKITAKRLSAITSTVADLKRLSPTDTIVLTPVFVRKELKMSLDGSAHSTAEESYWACQVESRKYCANGVDFGSISTLIQVSNSKILEFFDDEF